MPNILRSIKDMPISREVSAGVRSGFGSVLQRITNDTSAVSQFFRPSTFNEAKGKLYSGKYNPLTYTSKLGQFAYSDDPKKRQVETALNFSPVGVASTVERAGAKIAGAYLRGSSQTVKNLANQLNKAILDSRVPVAAKGQYMELINELSQSKVPANIVDRASNILQRGVKNDAKILDETARFTKDSRGLFTGSKSKK